LLRAAWTAQELLTTFEEELGEVALIPGTGGIFELSIISVYKTPSPIGFEGVRACFMASV
jgi:predicted Rdx family selenoprotein